MQYVCWEETAINHLANKVNIMHDRLNFLSIILVNSSSTQETVAEVNCILFFDDIIVYIYCFYLFICSKINVLSETVILFLQCSEKVQPLQISFAIVTLKRFRVNNFNVRQS